MDSLLFWEKFKNTDLQINTTLPKEGRFSLKKALGLPNIPHYMSIRAGSAYEKMLNYMVDLSSDCCLIKKKLGKHQLDLLFYNETTDTLYYFEIKTNIDHDSEKAPATVAKINEVIKEIEESGLAYKNLISGILCPTNKNDHGILYYGKIKVYCLEQFLNFLGLSIDTDYINQVYDNLFKEKIQKSMPEEKLKIWR